jgi:hypothetical protein
MVGLFEARIGGPLPAHAVPVIEVPPKVVAALGQREQPPVVVTINGHRLLDSLRGN